MKVASIVEGQGEVVALPVVLRRLQAWQTPGDNTQVITPIRVHRDRFINREEEFRRHLYLAAAKSGVGGWVLIVLDADDNCPADLGPRILERAKQCIPHRKISVVLANREYEAWFIAARASLNGHRGFSADPAEIIDAEEPRDAKGWLKARMASHTYGEVTDQPAFSAIFDLQQAHDGSRSFRKLCKEWRVQSQ